MTIRTFFFNQLTVRQNEKSNTHDRHKNNIQFDLNHQQTDIHFASIKYIDLKTNNQI